MPELPEVETVCRGLALKLVGDQFTAIDVRCKKLRWPVPKGVQQLLQHKIIGIDRRAKYILIHFAHNMTMIMHLGMSGRIMIDDTPEALALPLLKHDHVIFKTHKKLRLRFNDARRFGMVDIAHTPELSKHKLLKGLGPEPLDVAFTPAALLQQLRNCKLAIKLAIMDQKRVVGVGNIYAAEALFAAGIHPATSTAKVTLADMQRLVPAIKKVLLRSIEKGGSSLRDYVQTDGELGYFQREFSVYGREGQACKKCTCDPSKTGGVQRITQSGRSTFFCATKQKIKT